MRAYYKRFSVITGFTLLLLLFLAGAYITHREISRQIDDHAWVAHTQQLLLKTSQTESLLKDAETGQRGYLYTGEKKYLLPYTLAKAQIDPHLQQLDELAIDNPDQVARIAQLRLRSHEKLDELAKTIALYQAGKVDDARTMVLSGAGLSTMDDIRAVVDQMEREENSLLAARAEAYERSVRRTLASIYLGSIFAVVGLVMLAYFILREMALREKHATQIREREQWFRVTLTSVGDGVIATDPGGVVTFVNPVAEHLIGQPMSELKGKTIHQAFPIFNENTRQPVENPVRKVMDSGRIVGLANHTVLQRSDGTLIPIEDSAAPIRDDEDKLVGVVLVFRDATHERKSQELLRKAEKLAAASRLASTVAHEINNPLEAVGNLIYLAKATQGVPPIVVQQLTLAEGELDRVSHITRQTLGFYHESNAPAQVELPVLVESVLKLYSNKFRTKDIAVECDLEGCPPIQGWPGELKQLISNLISNAADAMSAHGVLKVKLACVERPDGQAAQLIIEDDGPGISSENVARIFEPFFTTKKNVGTGLGLWVAKEITERHGGTIQVRSGSGKGSHGAVFTVVLPCAANDQAQMADAS